MTPITLSIVCATIDPPQQVNLLLESIRDGINGVKSFLNVELIIVDQNDIGIFDDLHTSDSVKIIYIQSRVRGLSINRNIGLKHANGAYIMCIDSDCIFDKSFFINLLYLTNNRRNIDVFMGMITSIEYGKPLFRNWPVNERSINNFYVWQFSTSVNCVWSKAVGTIFDERFGIASTYGSCEDIDFFLRIKGKFLFSPMLIISHPDQSSLTIPITKTKSYSYGFGALCRKHILPFGILFLVLATIKKIIDLTMRKTSFNILIISLRSRLKGFIDFSPINDLK